MRFDLANIYRRSFQSNDLLDEFFDSCVDFTKSPVIFDVFLVLCLFKFCGGLNKNLIQFFMRRRKKRTSCATFCTLWKALRLKAFTLYRNPLCSVPAEVLDCSIESSESDISYSFFEPARVLKKCVLDLPQ